MSYKSIFLLLVFFIYLKTYSQESSFLPVSSNENELKIRTGFIKNNIEKLANESEVKLEYPIQSYYYAPYLSSNASRFLLSSDTTPPSDPYGLIVFKSSITSVYVDFSSSLDNESGISNYVFGIGSAPNLANIKWWQSIGNSAETPSLSLANLGIPEDSAFYITIYAINGAGLQSNHISTSSIKMHWENYGDSTNNITVQFANYGYDTNGVNIIAGWSPIQINKYNSFISKMLPLIKEIYGPPSHSYTVTLVRNLYYSSSNIFFPGSNQIHKDDNFLPQLLTHELIHAFRDDIILSMDSNWNYNVKLSGFEESFAQGVSYICMNRYIQLYPADSIANPGKHF